MLACLMQSYMTIDRVAYAKILSPHGDEGIRVVFSYHGDYPNDVFEFEDPSDVQYILAAIDNFVSPEYLMLTIRNQAELTVH